MPTSRHRSSAHGTRRRKASAPSSTSRPANGGGAQLAADPFVALDQGHGAAPARSPRERRPSPAMPPPTTTTWRHDAAAASTRSASAPITTGSSLSTRVRAKASRRPRRHLLSPRCRGRRAPRGGRPRTPAGTRTPPSARPVSAELADHLQHVGTAPRLGGGTGALPGDAPAGPRASPARRGDRVGAGKELVGVRVAREHPLGEAVGGEQDLVGRRAASPSPRRRHAARKSMYSGSRCQLSMAHRDRAPWLGRRRPAGAGTRPRSRAE